MFGEVSEESRYQLRKRKNDRKSEVSTNDGLREKETESLDVEGAFASNRLPSNKLYYRAKF